MAMTLKGRSAIAGTSILISTIVMLAPAHSQSASTSGNSSKLTLQGPAEPSAAPVLRDAVGRPCLDSEAAGRAHLVDPDLIDHIVSIKNNCPRNIRVKVCYFQSDRCRDLEIQGYKRVDTILGTMRKVSAFRYSISQK